MNVMHAKRAIRSLSIHFIYHNNRRRLFSIKKLNRSFHQALILFYWFCISLLLHIHYYAKKVLFTVFRRWHLRLHIDHASETTCPLSSVGGSATSSLAGSLVYDICVMYGSIDPTLVTPLGIIVSMIKKYVVKKLRKPLKFPIL